MDDDSFWWIRWIVLKIGIGPNNEKIYRIPTDESDKLLKKVSISYIT
jgi:hypothetical protein